MASQQVVVPVAPAPSGFDARALIALVVVVGSFVITLVAGALPPWAAALLGVVVTHYFSAKQTDTVVARVEGAFNGQTAEVLRRLDSLEVQVPPPAPKPAPRRKR